MMIINAAACVGLARLAAGVPPTMGVVGVPTRAEPCGATETGASLDRLVHGVKAGEADAINREGTYAQVRFLVESGLSSERIRLALRDRVPRVGASSAP